MTRFFLLIAALAYLALALVLWQLALFIGRETPAAGWVLIGAALVTFGTSVFTAFKALTWETDQ